MGMPCQPMTRDASIHTPHANTHTHSKTRSARANHVSSPGRGHSRAAGLPDTTPPRGHRTHTNPGARAAWAREKAAHCKTGARRRRGAGATGRGQGEATAKPYVHSKHTVSTQYRKRHVGEVGNAAHVERSLHAAVGAIHGMAALRALAPLHALLGGPDEADDAVGLVVLPQAIHFHGKVAGSAVLAQAVLVERDVRQLARQQPRHGLQRVLTHTDTAPTQHNTTQPVSRLPQAISRMTAAHTRQHTASHHAAPRRQNHAPCSTSTNSPPHPTAARGY